jgi:AcrR family transcriptional regulator
MQPAKVDVAAPASATRERILAAARKVFLDGPPEAATMDALAQEAGMSKKTIYREFKSQFELLAALAKEAAGEWTDVPPPTAKDDIEVELYGLIVRLVSLITAPRSMALFRLIISEVRRYPELMQRPKQSNQFPRQVIANWLASPVVRAKYTIDDPDDAAAMLMGMTMQDAGLKLLLSSETGPAMPLHLIEQRARRAVAIYLRGVRKGA